MKRVVLKKQVVAIFLGLLSVLPALGQIYETQQASRGQNSSDSRNRAKIHTELGGMYFQSGHMAAALDELAIAIRADSSFIPAYSVRGLVYTQLRDYTKAEEDFRYALNLAPNDPDVNNNYGWYLCETGRERQSIAYFLQALKNPLYETPDRAYANAGTCALKAGDMQGAEGYLLNALRFARDDATGPRLQLARLFFQRGINEEARIYLSEALKQMEPPTSEALWLGVRIERKLGNRSAESGYASQLRSRYPTSDEYQEFLKGNY